MIATEPQRARRVIKYNSVICVPPWFAFALFKKIGQRGRDVGLIGRGKLPHLRLRGAHSPRGEEQDDQHSRQCQAGEVAEAGGGNLGGLASSRCAGDTRGGG